MDKRILVDAGYPNNVQVAVVEDNKLEEIEYTSTVKKLIKGNIYLAKLTRIEPSLQAAFINYGEEKNGFISFSEVHPDYYNIPGKYKQNNQENTVDERREESESPLIENEAQIVEKDEFLADDAESISSEDEKCIEEVKRKNSERYKIQEVLKKDQILLVQVVKEARGTKGAMFTTYISLAGKYCVVMPKSSSGGGISRRITDIEARKKLQKVFDKINEKAQLSFIIRTAGQGHDKKDIQADYNYLVKLWNNIRERALSTDAPAFIHAEDDVLKKVVRELYDKDTKEIVIQGEEAYKNVVSTIKLMALTKYVKVRQYTENVPIFTKFKVNEQLASLYDSIVYLKSGSYIVINHTEALISIDVNSGRSTSERNVEETAIKTNIEAAKEIVRQIKLRDLSGLIVIDFIDMIESRNKSLVERTMRSLLRNDKARVQVGYISNFGLLEMSRQYLKPSFLDLNTVPCEQCKGSGVVKSNEVNAIKILRTIESEMLSNRNVSVLHVYLSSKMALFILNYKRKEIKDLENKYKISLIILQDYNMNVDCFAIEVINSKEDSEEKSKNMKIDSTQSDLSKTSEKSNKDKNDIESSVESKQNIDSKLEKQESISAKEKQKKLESNVEISKEATQIKEKSKKTSIKNSEKTKKNNSENKKKSRKTSKVKKLLDKLLG